MKLHALVVPYDSGFRGERMGAGPERLLSEGLLEGLRSRDRDVEVSVSTFAAAPDRLRGEIASAIEIQQWLAAQVAQTREASALPIVLAGNCVSAIGTVAGLQARSRKQPGVCWFDAHADFNTPETTESGFLDGMALAMLTGRCWPRLAKQVPGFTPIPDAQVVLFGVRNVQAAEDRLLAKTGIHRVKPPFYGSASSDILGSLRDRIGEVYLHIDLDVLDLSEGRANPYATAGGLSRARLCELVEEIVTSFHVGALAFTAYDPASDTENRIPAIARELLTVIARATT